MTIKHKLAILAFLSVPLAHAADDSSTEVKVKPKPWQASVELGFLMNSGNTDSTNFNTKINATQELIHWRNNYTLSSQYTRADDNKTAENYNGTLESNYKFNDSEFWYVRGAYKKDLFSGYDYQSNVSTGYGDRFIQSQDGSYVEATVGVGYRYNQLEDTKTTTDTGAAKTPIVRFAITGMKQLSPTAMIEQTLDTNIGTIDGSSITKAVSSLQTNIRNDLAMKLSYTVEHSSTVPEGTENTDTTTSVTLLYSF